MKTVLYIYLVSIILQIDLFHFKGYNIGLSDVLYIFVFYFFVIHISIRRKSVPLVSGLGLPIFLLIILALISYALNLYDIDVENSFTYFVKWISAWFIFFIVRASFKNNSNTELLHLKNLILISGLLMVILSVINSLFPVEISSIFQSGLDEERLRFLASEGVTRYFLPLWGPNRFAAYLLLPNLICLSFFILDKSAKTKKRLLYFFLIIIFSFALIHTYSRGAIGALLIGLLIPIKHSKLSSKVYIPILLAVCCVMLYLFFPSFLDPYYVHREYITYAPLDIDSFGAFGYVKSHILGRFYIQTLVINAFIQNPVWGKGYGAILEGGYLNFSHAHNSYLSALYCLGIFGFFTYLLILYKMIGIFIIKIKSIIIFDQVKIIVIAFFSWYISLLLMSFVESPLFQAYEIITILMYLVGTTIDTNLNQTSKYFYKKNSPDSHA